MPQFNDTELTAAIRSFEETPDRGQIPDGRLVKSLHDFVRKTDLTFDEWGRGHFLTRRPEMLLDRREFILLSDVLGVLDAGRCGEPSRAPGDRTTCRPVPMSANLRCPWQISPPI
jgi:hypothetical protein